MLLRKKAKRSVRTSAKKPVQGYTDYYRSESKRSVGSGSSLGSGDNPPIQRRTSVKVHVGRLPAYFAGIIILFSLLYSSIISNNVLVLLPEGKGLFERSYYEAVASDIMGQSIANKTKFTFNAGKFKNDFIRKVPEISSVNLSVPLAGKKTVAGVTFVSPLYIFSVNNAAYIVGSNGVILADASKVSDAKKADLRYIRDDAPLNVSIGKTVLLESDVRFLQQMYKEFDAAKVVVQIATLPLGAGELYVRPAGEKYDIKFALSGDAKQQVGAYLALRDSGELSQLPESYIDVRLGDRLFVK